MEVVPNMPSSTCLIILFSIFIITIFRFQVSSSAADFVSPLVSPFIEDLCTKVGCGNGKCKMSSNNDFEYECECDPGWKQTAFSNSTVPLKFLPCVVPNCTLDYSCSEAASPAPSLVAPLNASITDPCHWANCGGGVCNKTSAVTYVCNCKVGYNNLLNNTVFPCYEECSIGGDCSNLGITVSNTSTATPPNLADTGSNHAFSIRDEAFFHGVIVLAIQLLLCSLCMKSQFS